MQHSVASKIFKPLDTLFINDNSSSNNNNNDNNNNNNNNNKNNNNNRNNNFQNALDDALNYQTIESNP